jgi:PLP dependent protein
MTNVPAVAALADIKARIAAVKVARPGPPPAKLIAVSKTYDADAILPVLEAGHRSFGENRVQEALAKWPDLRLRFSDIDLHLIGPLQSNKAKEAVALFDCIHTIDRSKIAEAIATEMSKQARRLKLFVQINTGEEPQKAGIIPRETMAFVTMCRNNLNLDIAGLMCIPPVDEEPAVHFAFLAKLAREANLPELSMGMSADFETAVEFGATYVRIGSAIFGSRG